MSFRKQELLKLLKIEEHKNHQLYKTRKKSAWFPRHPSCLHKTYKKGE
jgi:hypothetical protein